EVMIANPDLLEASASADLQVSCFDASDATLTIVATGGTGSYTYSLNGGTPQLSNVFENLSAGSYTVEVVDEMGCSVLTNEVMISNPDLLEASASADFQVSCFDASDATLTVLATGGTGSYTYILNGGTPQLSNVFENLSAGNYTVEVVDEMGCSVLTNELIINNPPILSAEIIADPQVSCYNCSDASLSVFVSGGTGDYQYSLNGGDYQSSNTFTGLAAGLYKVEVIDEMGCTTSSEYVEILNPESIRVDLDVDTQVSCFNSSDASIVVNVSGGTGEFQYSLNGGDYQSSNTFTGLAPGLYKVEVVDEMGCTTSTEYVEIQNPEALIANLNADSQVSCFNSSDASIVVNVFGGTGSILYSLNGGEYQPNGSFNNLTAGEYTVVVMDEMGCEYEAESVFVDNPSELQVTVNADPQVSCYQSYDASILVEATGGTGDLTYVLNGSISQSDGLFENIPAGYHNVIVTDENGCVVETEDIIISSPSPIVINTIATDMLCHDSEDGTIEVDVVGGNGNYTYLLNGEVSQENNMFIGLSNGEYSVVVTDENGCSATSEPTYVRSPQKLEGNLEARSQVTCYGMNDGALSVEAWGGTGDYSFVMSYAGDLFDIDDRSSYIWENLGAGNYSVTVTDGNGCSIALSDEIETPSPITILYEPRCIAGVISIDIDAVGGNGGYHFSIDGGQNYQSSGFFTDLIDQSTLHVYATDMNNCVSQEFAIPVSSLNTLEAYANVVNDNMCYGLNDAIVEIEALGGVPPYSYQIGDMVYTDNVLTQLPAGEIDVLVRDSNGCPAETEVYVEVGEPLEVELVSKTNADCNGNNDGSLELELYGGNAPYELEWSNGLTDANVYNLNAGPYTLTVTDLRGCETTHDFIVDSEQIYDVPEVNNVFTPNNDGINDFFVIDNIELYPDNELVVLNRWGNEVYTKQSYDNSWNGSSLSEGTYFYILTVKMCEEYKTINGYITILE
ncbi:MAG: hypothetical protein C0596_11700, partial [Marinilabiliales bacterium]